eukprot:GHVO01032171.1.p1 GENE.GHVO01032171.1~~GHVO01032171.1.p1  ORF type:complete len:253 (+),score=34.58 GHVO01032171.1:3-761(+)
MEVPDIDAPNDGDGNKYAAVEVDVQSNPENDEQHWRTILSDSWYEALETEIKKPYFLDCLDRVKKLRGTKTVYPDEDMVFNAFRQTPLTDVKVVIVGQDPYHGPKQAMGLCFSVHRSQKVPPSLVNIYKEAGIESKHGDLTSWAQQGIFLLNDILTVERGAPMSHSKLGWTKFTDRVIEILNSQKKDVVFLLWGNAAKAKAKKVSRSTHKVLEAGHPSPLSVRFFKGCNHFDLCNEHLTKLDKEKIKWELPN